MCRRVKRPKLSPAPKILKVREEPQVKRRAEVGIPRDSPPIQTVAQPMTTTKETSGNRRAEGDKGADAAAGVTIATRIKRERGNLKATREIQNK